MIATILSHSALPLTVFLASAVCVRLLQRWLIRQSILDLPNERSSHSAPTPRGGGLAVMAVVLAVWSMLSLQLGAPQELWIVIPSALLLMGLSWIDDRRGLSPLIRLAVQAIAVCVGLLALPAGPVFQDWLPWWLDRALAGLAWLWFVNLFNFMDGIDGISGVETIAIGTGVALLVDMAALHPDLQTLALVLVAAALGFLVWNWHPAKIFLGDVGSVPLGFLLGWLLLTLAALGLWAPALLLPAYYLADATITLGKRALRREKIWQAHRSHFYQQAVQAGNSHARVASWIGLTNFLLIGLALLSLENPAPALGGGLLVIGLLLALLGRKRP
ncbi:UDP-N-acetylmuramyl pentapeptide phosphotransferase [Rhodospirillaceae bacterium LM-1]|nr:UDP-N-acetylmuramyl pentapeptide phosphotransferase [Rhodospirillaceae bacterium LM-1]